LQIKTSLGNIAKKQKIVLFRLTVTDSDGESNSTTANVTVIKGWYNIVYLWYMITWIYIKFSKFKQQVNMSLSKGMICISSSLGAKLGCQFK